MNNCTSEIHELSRFLKSITGKMLDLEKELNRLLKVEDEIGLLVSSRRCLEVIVRENCVKEEIKISDTIPLKGSPFRSVPTKINASLSLERPYK